MAVSAENIVVIATMRAREGSEDVLRSALVEVTPPSLAEPGCHMYLVNRSTEEPSTFFVIAAFASIADLESHGAQPHSERFREQTADAFKEPFTTAVLEPLAAG